MQEKVQFTGIVVKNLDYQDNAQIVYILTKDELRCFFNPVIPLIIKVKAH